MRSASDRGNSIACIRTFLEATDAIKAAGSSLEVAEDFAEHKDHSHGGAFTMVLRSMRTLYLIRSVSIGRAIHPRALSSCWLTVTVRMTRYGRVGLDVTIKALKFVRIARKGTEKKTKESINGAKRIGKAGRQYLFTPMYFTVGAKKDVTAVNAD